MRAVLSVAVAGIAVASFGGSALAQTSTTCGRALTVGRHHLGYKVIANASDIGATHYEHFEITDLRGKGQRQGSFTGKFENDADVTGTFGPSHFNFTIVRPGLRIEAKGACRVDRVSGTMVTAENAGEHPT